MDRHLGRAVLILLLVAGQLSCMAPKRPAGLPAEGALAPSAGTSLGCVVARSDPPGSDPSGFGVLDTSRSAFLARLDLVDLAERSLDLQYYIWEDDLTGRLFLDRVAQAARRGVRVRILIDDFPGARKDERLRAIALQAGVQVRLFNPFGSRRLPHLRRWAEFVVRFGTLNHRMHNKLLVADGAFSVIGGRNIGDPYFGVAQKGYNHRDFDLLCAGPIVGQMSANFDEFWNSSLAFPVESLHSVAMSAERAAKVWSKLERRVKGATLPEYLQRPPLSRGEREEGLLADMVWARGTLVADGPEKVTGGGQAVMMDALRHFGGQAQHEVVVVTAYYGDLGKGMTEPALEAASRQGIHLRMLVNSLASIDGPWADVGYKRERQALLHRGVELYEARPDALSRAIHSDMRDPAIRLVLHSKVAVADRRLVFTGTMNLDPRSFNVNTEAGVMVDSPELAERVLAAIDTDFRPENAWHVELASRCDGKCPKGLPPEALVWIPDTARGEDVHSHEPDVSFWRLISRFFFDLFPINGLL